MVTGVQERYWWKSIASFLLVLFMMPLGHALMILMEHWLHPTALHYAAFAMGAVGVLMVVIGVFVKGDTKQTLWGLFGGLLFWTGWVEFLFMYYANRFGVQPLIVDGEVVTRPEYLILPASFGFWAMFMLLYLFCVPTGCNFINWWQKVLFRGRKSEIVARPMTRHTSIVTFMQLNMMMWTCYLALMFCYDDHVPGRSPSRDDSAGHRLSDSAPSLSSGASCASANGAPISGRPLPRSSFCGCPSRSWDVSIFSVRSG